MIRILISTLCTVLLLACGDQDPQDWFKFKLKDRVSVPKKDIDPLFLPAIERFQEQATSRGVALPHMDKLRVVKFGTPTKEGVQNVVGLCTTYTYDGELIHSKIVIDEMFRELMYTQPKRYEALMFHELGHCVLERDHEEELYVIMYPSLAWEGYYTKHWSWLLDQFLDHSTETAVQKLH